MALNRCFDDQEVKTQQYGITISGDQTNAAVLDNQLAGNLIAPMDETGLGTQTNYSTRLLP